VQFIYSIEIDYSSETYQDILVGEGGGRLQSSLHRVWSSEKGHGSGKTRDIFIGRVLLRLHPAQYLRPPPLCPTLILHPSLPPSAVQYFTQPPNRSAGNPRHFRLRLRIERGVVGSSLPPSTTGSNPNQWQTFNGYKAKQNRGECTV